MPGKTHPVLCGVTKPSPHLTVTQSVWHWTPASQLYLSPKANPDITWSELPLDSSGFFCGPSDAIWRLSTKFCENCLSSVCVILLINKQSDNVTSLTGNQSEKSIHYKVFHSYRTLGYRCRTFEWIVKYDKILQNLASDYVTSMSIKIADKYEVWWICNYILIANLLLTPMVKEIRKSVNIWRSYLQE